MLQKIFKFPERAAMPIQQHAPQVPVLSENDLGLLRRIFIVNNYSSEPSVENETGPAILKQLFAHGLTVTHEQAEFVFHPLSLELLIRSGLLTMNGNEIKSLFQAQPYRGLIFFSDFFEWEDSSDFVLPIGPAGHYLANLTIRQEVRSTLDLGCGCGIQSLLAAHHSERVTATDINPRAIAMTRLNAALNGINNIDILEGSYFEPVEGQTFDLILANLPYVITPEIHHVYMDVDQPGDIGLRRRLKEIPIYLNEGGFAQLLVNWVYRKNEGWWQPLQQTLKDSDSDTWLIYTSTKQPDEYADIWIDQRTRNDEVKFKKTKQAWLNWYRSHHIPQIALGAVVLRRRTSNNNWFQVVQAKKNLEGSAGAQFLRQFAMADLLVSLENPDKLLDKILVPLDLKLSPFNTTETLLVSQTKGLRLETEVEPATMAVLHQLDGNISLKTAIQKISLQSEYSANDIQGFILSDLKTLIQYGMLAFE
jgi:SAM-dependent methyltransferase